MARPQVTPSGRQVSGSHWGISKSQIRDLVAQCRTDTSWSSSDSIRDFVAKSVKPRTQGLGMGLALSLNRDAPLKANLMISHAWDENALGFFQDIEAHVREEEVMFICFFALYQCEDSAGPSIGEQLGPDVRGGPFAEVIAQLKPAGLLADLSNGWLARPQGRMLVVTCEECDLYSRLWCVWEAYVALSLRVPVAFAGRGQIFGTDAPSSKFARCGDPRRPMNEDERKIREAIESLPVETWRSRLGNVGAVVALLAAILVPLGLGAGWALGLAIAGTAVSAVRYGLQFISWLSIFLPFTGTTARIFAWVLSKVGAGLFAGSVACLFSTVLGALILWHLFPRRRIQWTGRFSAKLADNRDGYARLDAVVRRAAGEN